MTPLGFLVNRERKLNEAHSKLNDKLDEALGFSVVFSVHVRNYAPLYVTTVSIWKAGADNRYTASYKFKEEKWEQVGMFEPKELETIQAVLGGIYEN